MSVQINCDRCRKNTKGYFLNVRIEITRGAYASTHSKVLPARNALPFHLNWQVCETCERDLRHWQRTPDEAAA